MPRYNRLFSLFAFSLLLTPFSSQVGTAASLASLPRRTTTVSQTGLSVSNKAGLVAELAFQVAAASQSESAQQLFERALQIAQAIPPDEFGGGEEQKIGVLSAIAVQLAKAGQTKRAQEVFAQAEKLVREKLSIWEQDSELSNIAIKLAEAGLTEKALQVAKTLSQDYLRAEALNGIASQLAEVGELNRAKQILSDALKIAQTISRESGYESNGFCAIYKYQALTAIAQNLALVNEVQTALDITKTVSSCSSASGEGGTRYQQDGLLGIVSYLMKGRELMQTQAVAQTLADQADKNRVLYAIAVKLAEVGEAKLAQQTAQSISDAQIKELALLSAASFSVKTPDQEQAQQLLSQAQTIATTSQSFLLGETLSHVAVNLVAVGQTEKALQLAQMESNNSYIPPEVLKDVAVKLAAIAQFEQALQLVETFKDDRLKGMTLSDVVAQLKDVPSVNRALQIANIIEFKDYSDSDYQKGEMLLNIAKKLAELKQNDLAQQVAQSIKNDSWKAQALATVAAQLNQSRSSKIHLK